MSTNMNFFFLLSVYTPNVPLTVIQKSFVLPEVYYVTLKSFVNVSLSEDKYNTQFCMIRPESVIPYNNNNNMTYLISNEINTV